MNGQNLKQVYADTKEKCVGKFRKLDTKPSVLYKFMYRKPKLVRRFENTNIEVINEDTLVTVEKYAKSDDPDDKNVVALNMASSYNPGGGAHNGRTAQEETLFYRTTYHTTLLQDFYPLRRPNVIYSEKVWVIKDRAYKDLSEPFYTAFIAGAAPRHPTLSDDGTDYAYERDFEMLYQTIENIFKCAYCYGHTTLILGGLGCGAYRNPPMRVIEAFNSILEQYDGCFKNIIFAVYSKNDNNFDLFKSHIDGQNESE